MLISLFILLVIMCIINFLIDTRFVGYSATVAIVGLTLIVKATAKNDSISMEMLIVGMAIIIISYILPFITRKIEGVELFYMSKKHFIVIIPVSLGLYAIGFSELPMNLFGKSLCILFCLYIIALLFELSIQIVYSYFLLWINYFWGREYIYKNTKMRVEVRKVRYKTAIFNSYYVEDYGNKQIKFNKKSKDYLEKKYSFCSKKNITNADSLNESYKFTETLKVKISPIFKKIIVVKLKS